MTHNTVLNPYKPLLKSYFTNNYQKLYLDHQIQSEKYYLNQSEEFWDLVHNTEKENFINEQFAKQNRPFSLHDYHQLFSSKINLDNFKSQQTILDKIYHDVSKMYTILKKLDEIGLSYSFDITGGAVRDFTNNKPLKDLDIMLSIFDTDHNKSILNKINDISFLKTHFQIESIIYCLQEIVTTSHNDKDFIAKKQQLVTLCFHDYISEKFTFTSSNREEKMSVKNLYEENMLKHNRLLGVFKLCPEKMQLNYPIDILLTDFHKIEFIKDFDLDICKASFSLVNSVYKTAFPSNSLELISRFTAELDFWADIHNKKITLNVDNMSNKTIENSITKHYKRLKEKYPDYELNIISSKTFIDNLNFAKSIYLAENLRK